MRQIAELEGQRCAEAMRLTAELEERWRCEETVLRAAELEEQRRAEEAVRHAAELEGQRAVGLWHTSHAAWYWLLAALWGVGATIFATSHFKVSSGRLGLTRACVCVCVCVVFAVDCRSPSVVPAPLSTFSVAAAPRPVELFARPWVGVGGAVGGWSRSTSGRD